eukprot:GSMAST32.ASY1.ANO1.1727.1 assembled CDS
MGILEKIEAIELEMRRTQKNKATIGGGEGFAVAKSGDARVALIGFPSVGKSTLLSTLTDTKSEQAAYEFTTLTCIPGNIFYKGVKIQLLDLPGIIEGASHGKGRGREVIAVAKSADLILIVLDAANEGKKNHLEILRTELETVAFKKKMDGGVKFNTVVKLTKFGDNPAKAVKQILHEYKIHNAEVLFRGDYSPDELIDVIEGNRKYCRCIHVWNKCDLVSIEDCDRLARTDYSVVCSVSLKLNMDRLLERMWYEMGLVRIYTKKRGQAPDLEEPVVLSNWRHGTTIDPVDLLECRTFTNRLAMHIIALQDLAARERRKQQLQSQFLNDLQKVDANQNGNQDSKIMNKESKCDGDENANNSSIKLMIDINIQNNSDQNDVGLITPQTQIIKESWPSFENKEDRRSIMTPARHTKQTIKERPTTGTKRKRSEMKFLNDEKNANENKKKNCISDRKKQNKQNKQNNGSQSSSLTPFIARLETNDSTKSIVFPLHNWSDIVQGKRPKQSFQSKEQKVISILKVDDDNKKRVFRERRISFSSEVDYDNEQNNRDQWNKRPATTVENNQVYNSNAEVKTKKKSKKNIKSKNHKRCSRQSG